MKCAGKKSMQAKRSPKISWSCMCPIVHGALGEIVWLIRTDLSFSSTIRVRLRGALTFIWSLPRNAAQRTRGVLFTLCRHLKPGEIVAVLYIVIFLAPLRMAAVAQQYIF